MAKVKIKKEGPPISGSGRKPDVAQIRNPQLNYCSMRNNCIFRDNYEAITDEI